MESAEPEIAKAQIERDIAEARLKKLKTDIAAGKSEFTDEIHEIAESLGTTSIPSPPRLICGDVTVEKLVELLADNGGVLAQFSTEGGIFQILGGLYRDGELAIDIHLKAYSGDPIYYDRKRGKSLYVPSPCLTVTIMVQPDVIRSLGKKPGLRGRGLLARFLYAWPRSIVGYRKLHPDPISDATRILYRGVIENLESLPKETDAERHVILLDDNAKVVFDKWRDGIERQLQPGGDLREIRDWVLKLPGAVLRLTGVLHALEHHALVNLHETPISESVIHNAIRLGEYYVGHALVAFDQMGLDGVVSKARDLWASIERLVRTGRLNTAFSQRDLHQHVRSSFQNVGELSDALRVLQEMNYVRQVHAPSTGKGRPPGPRWEINPFLPEDSPDDTTQQYFGQFWEEVAARALIF